MCGLVPDRGTDFMGFLGHVEKTNDRDYEVEERYDILASITFGGPFWT